MRPGASLRGALLAAAAAVGSAQTWYPFNTGWNMVSSAALAPGYGSDVVQITPPVQGVAGAVWYNNFFWIENFDLRFQLSIQDTSNPPADGICFVLQNDPFIGTTGIGGAGGGFGYAGIQKSVAICLDTYSGTSPNYLATGAWSGGNIQQVSPFLLHVPIANGAWYQFQIIYRRATGVLSWYVDGAGYQESFSQNVGDIVTCANCPGNSRAWFGVTAANGGCWERHLMRNFTWAALCPAPSVPGNVQLTQINSNTYKETCIPGLQGAIMFRTSDPATCAYSGSDPACFSCPVGSYCPGTGSAIACPAGSYGNALGLMSSYCSGTCSAGYQCPTPGSTTPTYQVCGGTGNLYCPPGTATPLTVSAGYYTGPLTNSIYTREWQAPCPSGRLCNSGIVAPAVDFGGTCPNGALSLTVPENAANVVFSSAIVATTPGANVTLNYTAAVAATGSCTAPQSVVFSNTTRMLGLTSALDATFCTQGFGVVITATRSNDPTLYATCVVNVTVLQVGRQPKITDCAPRNISERTITGTFVGTPLGGSVNNTGTTLLWSIDDANALVYIDACTGQMKVKSYLDWNVVKNFTVPIRLSNTGLPPVLSDTCNVTVRVNRVNYLPVVTQTSFLVKEQSGVGTLVAMLTATDANGDTVTGWNFTAVDSPDAFAVNSTTGALTVKSAVLNVDIKSTFAYTLSYTDGYGWASTPILITLTAVPKPPTTFAQIRTVSEAIPGGYRISPALNATHSQGVNFTFVQLAPNDTFSIYPNGTVYLLPAAQLNYQVQNSYTNVFTVRDGNGLIASSTIQILVTEVNKPPIFAGGASKTFAFGVYEGTAPGFAVGDATNPTLGMNVAATDPNVRDIIQYSVSSVNPPQAAALFSIGVINGGFTVAAGVPTGALWFDPAWNWPLPQTAIVNVTATDSGSPRMWDNATATIKIVNVKPRLPATATANIPADSRAGALVYQAVAWTPYASGIVGYSILNNALDTQGRAAFVVNSTGWVSLQTFAGNTPPSFDYNTRSLYNITVGVTDINGMTASMVLYIQLQHVNRAPVWGRPPTIYAAALTSGNIGSALRAYVSDADLSLPSSLESFTFAILAGNTDSTFAITSSDGQIYVANNATPSFQYPGSYNLTIRVTDAAWDGPAYSAQTWVFVNLTRNQIPPDVPFYNLTVNEHAAVGSTVATVAATTRNVGLTLTYQLAGAGPNAYAPFPFNITTLAGTGVGGVGTGQIRVTPAISIEYWTGFQVYQATLTVCDSSPTSLCTSIPLLINVRWVAEPPYFNTVTKSPNSAVFNLAVDEHSPAGTSVNASVVGGDIRGFTKDPWQRPLLTYTWAQPASGAFASYFTLDATTGVVSVAAAAGDLQYNTRTSYTLTVMVRDALGMTDNATVVITINDVNDPAVFQGIWDATNTTNITVPGLAIREDTPPGTLVGYARFVDPDRSPTALAGGWNKVVYSQQTIALQAAFNINGTTGAITVASPSILDFWDATTVPVVATAQDGMSALVGYGPFTVRLIQVNRVVVSGFAVDTATPAVAGYNATTPGGSAGVAGANDAIFRTNGGVKVLVYGSGFGRTVRRLTTEGLPLTGSTTVVNATFGPTGKEYNATGCAIVQPNTLAACWTTAGVGAGHVWNVTIDRSWASLSTAKTAFLPPAITNVTKFGAPLVGSTWADHEIDTRGTAFVVVNCTNCGQAPAVVSLLYGRYVGEYTSPSCTWLVPQASLRCATAAGVGTNLQFAISVGAQLSPAFTDSMVHYKPPVITAVSAPLMDTAGRLDTITINGDWFGPAGTTEIVMRYTKSFAQAAAGNASLYTGSNCTVVAAHTRITCLSDAGIGAGLVATVAVGSQTSAASTGTIAYLPPIVTGIAGATKDSLDTLGGQTIVLSGRYFGPVTPLSTSGLPFGPTAPGAQYGPLSVMFGNDTRGLKPYNASNCFVSRTGVQMVCTTVPGVAAGLLWRAVIGDQPSPVYTGDSTSYTPPVVISYNPSLHPNTAGGDAVFITGKAFGPLNTPIDLARYGRNGSNPEFTATNCTLLTADTLISCTTAVGAGSGLQWLITIGGQVSVRPSTAYGRPVVTAFGGMAANASTEGGDVVVLYGTYFSIQKHLVRVTYGPTGAEFTAKDCNVTVNHTAIECRMVAGTGRTLRWMVTVGDQTSLPSDPTTSYAAPSITAVDPVTLPTDPTKTATQVKVSGFDFALSYPAAAVTIKFNCLGAPVPPANNLAIYWAAAYNGSTAALSGDPSTIAAIANVTAWLNMLPTFMPASVVNHGRAGQEISFIAPEGFGASAQVIVLVDNVPSNMLVVHFQPPTITNIAPDRDGVPLGFLRVFVDGANLCNGLNGCGTLLINNATVYPSLWSHTSVLAIIPDLPTGSGAVPLQIIVGDQASNIRWFNKPVPSINALAAQGVWRGMRTVGGEAFWVGGVMNVGMEAINVTIGPQRWPCTNVTREVTNGLMPTDPSAEFTISCITPPGVGFDLAVVITSQGGSSRENSPVLFSYSPPTITDMLDATTGASLLAPARRPPTLGLSEIFLVGSDLGLPTLDATAFVTFDDVSIVNITAFNQTHVRASLPQGDGSAHFFRYSIGRQASTPLVITYAAPQVFAITPTHGLTDMETEITVFGANFGITAPNITLGPGSSGMVLQCALPGGASGSFVPSPGHDVLNCTVPTGQGVGLEVAVRVSGQRSATMQPPLTARTFDFDAPVVDAIMPAAGPTSGRALGAVLPDGIHRAQGARIPTTIAGRNLGKWGTIQLAPTVSSDPLATNITVPSADVVSWNDTAITFYMPEGFGDNLLTRVYADQWSALPWFTQGQPVPLFSYLPPEVNAVIRQDKPYSQCQPYDICFEAGNATRCRQMFPGCWPTKGGYLVEVVGASFGAQTQGIVRAVTTVTIGGKVCIPIADTTLIAMQGHGSIICRAPVGMGESLPVYVTVGTRTSVDSGNASRMSYDPPVVTLMSPNTPTFGPEERPPTVLIKGFNMGLEISPLRIAINDEEATTREWLNDGTLTFQPPQQVVGAKNVSILVANRTTPYEFFDLEEALVYLCAKDYYGMEGEVCLSCPQGASCPGGERLKDLVNATDGFWRSDLDVDTQEAGYFCDAPRRQSRAQCPAFLACGPSEACLAGNICAEGYEGDRCSQCLKGKYHRVNDACVKCPNNVPVLYAGIAVLLMLMVAFAWWLNKKNINLAIIAIGVDYAQVVSMFARTKIRWPAALVQLFRILSAFSLNLDIAAPECLNPEITFWQKWFFVESVPLAVAAIMYMSYVVRYVYKALFLNVSKKDRSSHYTSSISTFIVLFRLLFLYLTKTSFDVLNCTPTDPPQFRDPIKKTGSIEYMSGLVQPEYECWAKGSWQVFLFPFGVATLATYSFAVPAVALWFLQKNKELVKTDQILRAKDTGDDTLTNPRAYQFRLAFSKLYYHFLPGKWYWEFCITARKIFIAGTSLAFRQVPSYQLAIALLVLFAAYVLQVVHRPYMSHETKPQVVDEHMKKSLYDPMHMRIEAEMRAAEKKNRKATRRANVFDVAARASKKDVGSAILMEAFSSNTVEAILLGCCVLVSLAGIMLDSKRFDGDSWYIPQVQREYIGLSYGCLLVIVVSLVYYAFVFSLEMMAALCPEAIPVVLSFCCRKKQNAARRTEAGKRRMSQVGGGGGGSGGSGPQDGVAEIAVNPLLLRQQAADSLGMDVDGFLDAQQLLGIAEPSPAMWKAVQGSYAKAMNMLQTMRAEVRVAKHQLEKASLAAEDATAASATRVPRAANTRTGGATERRQFTPVQRGAADSDGSDAAAAMTSLAAYSSPLAKNKTGPRLQMARRKSMSAGSMREAAAAAAGPHDDTEASGSPIATADTATSDAATVVVAAAAPTITAE